MTFTYPSHTTKGCVPLSSDVTDNTYSVAAGSEAAGATSISIPAVYKGKPVSTISKGAFSNLSNLSSVTIADSVTKIEDNAFTDCKSLTTVTGCEGVVSFGDYAFFGCKNISSITIPASCEKIGERCFDSMQSASTITVNPDSLNYIGKFAFGYEASIVWNSDEYTKWKVEYIGSDYVKVYDGDTGEPIGGSIAGRKYYIGWYFLNRTNANETYRRVEARGEIIECERDPSKVGCYLRNVSLYGEVWVKE